MCEVRIRLWNRAGRISHAEALISMSEAIVNSSPLLFRCVFVSDSSIFVTNILSLILGIIVAVVALPDGEKEKLPRLGTQASCPGTRWAKRKARQSLKGGAQD